jgi:hypothetical protein
MPTTPPFDPPFKARIAEAGNERWVEVLADGSQVDCAAPATSSYHNASSSAGSAAPEKSAPRSQGKGLILNVPFAEKDEAKQLGAKWDATRRKWYVPPGVDAAAFSRWASS